MEKIKSTHGEIRKILKQLIKDIEAKKLHPSMTVVMIKQAKSEADFVLKVKENNESFHSRFAETLCSLAMFYTYHLEMPCPFNQFSYDCH